MRSHPVVENILSAGVECLIERVICEPPVVQTVGEDPGPVGGCQAFVGLLGPKGFLSCGYPHEMSVAVSGVVIHEYGGCLESHVG